MSGGAIILSSFIGLFFALSGWHKTFHAERWSSLRTTLAHDLGLTGLALTLITYWVAVWELVAGSVATLAVVWYLIGLPFITHLALFPLAVICVVAAVCEGWSQVMAMKPFNCLDVTCCWLYLSEILLLLGIFAVWLGV